MGTIYKIEMELVSDYASYSEDDMRTIICSLIDTRNEKQKKFQYNTININFDKFKVTKIK